MTPTHRRFVEQIEKRDDGHWYWTGSTDGLGRGTFQAVGDKFLANRVSWMIANRRKAEGFQILPTCGVDECIHPEHLSAKRIDVGTSLYDG